MAEVRWINNLKGTLYYLDTPILKFEIANRKLVYSEDLSERKYYPWELAEFGVSYANINAFFERRTIKEGCMFYHEHLKAIGLDHFDFDKYIKIKRGDNNLDNYWGEFE